jgi:hypothetical protein
VPDEATGRISLEPNRNNQPEEQRAKAQAKNQQQGDGQSSRHDAICTAFSAAEAIF